MKIYRIGMYEKPTVDGLMSMKSAGFAHFSAVGTWAKTREKCDVCGWSYETIVSPLLVQWEPSTDVIGDFSWDGPFGYTFIAKELVANALQAMQFECELLEVAYVKPVAKRKTVPFPYTGPKLFWGECLERVELDKEASGVEQKSSCTACGDIRYTFRMDGVVIRRKHWSGQKMFRIASNGYSDATFVTTEGRRLIEKAGFTNIAFTEAGEIV